MRGTGPHYPVLDHSNHTALLFAYRLSIRREFGSTIMVNGTLQWTVVQRFLPIADGSGGVLVPAGGS